MPHCIKDHEDPDRYAAIIPPFDASLLHGARDVQTTTAVAASVDDSVAAESMTAVAESMTAVADSVTESMAVAESSSSSSTSDAVVEGQASEDHQKKRLKRSQLYINVAYWKDAYENSQRNMRAEERMRQAAEEEAQSLAESIRHDKEMERQRNLEYERIDREHRKRFPPSELQLRQAVSYTHLTLPTKRIV